MGVCIATGALIWNTDYTFCSVRSEGHTNSSLTYISCDMIHSHVCNPGAADRSPHVNSAPGFSNITRSAKSILVWGEAQTTDTLCFIYAYIFITLNIITVDTLYLKQTLLFFNQCIYRLSACTLQEILVKMNVFFSRDWNCVSLFLRNWDIIL